MGASATRSSTAYPPQAARPPPPARGPPPDGRDHRGARIMERSWKARNNARTRSQASATSATCWRDGISRHGSHLRTRSTSAPSIAEIKPLFGGRRPDKVDVAGLVYGREEADQFMHLGDGVLRSMRKALGEDGADGFLLGHIGPLIDTRIPEQGGQNLDRAVDVSRRELRQPVHDAEGIGGHKAGLQHLEQLIGEPMIIDLIAQRPLADGA